MAYHIIIMVYYTIIIMFHTIIMMIIFPRDIVCLRNMSINTLHKGDYDYDDDDDNNNNGVSYRVTDKATQPVRIFRTVQSADMEG